jgi:hypothetical protein
MSLLFFFNVIYYYSFSPVYTIRIPYAGGLHYRQHYKMVKEDVPDCLTKFRDHGLKRILGSLVPGHPGMDSCYFVSTMGDDQNVLLMRMPCHKPECMTKDKHHHVIDHSTAGVCKTQNQTTAVASVFFSKVSMDAIMKTETESKVPGSHTLQSAASDAPLAVHGGGYSSDFDDNKHVSLQFDTIEDAEEDCGYPLVCTEEQGTGVSTMNTKPVLGRRGKPNASSAETVSAKGAAKTLAAAAGRAATAAVAADTTSASSASSVPSIPLSSVSSSSATSSMSLVSSSSSTSAMNESSAPAVLATTVVPAFIAQAITSACVLERAPAVVDIAANIVIQSKRAAGDMQANVHAALSSTFCKQTKKGKVCFCKRFNSSIMAGGYQCSVCRVCSVCTKSVDISISHLFCRTDTCLKYFHNACVKGSDWISPAKLSTRRCVVCDQNNFHS